MVQHNTKTIMSSTMRRLSNDCMYIHIMGIQLNNLITTQINMLLSFLTWVKILQVLVVISRVCSL